jgi:hypothetical protein
MNAQIEAREVQIGLEGEMGTDLLLNRLKGSGAASGATLFGGFLCPALDEPVTGVVFMSMV